MTTVLKCNNHAKLKIKFDKLFFLLPDPLMLLEQNKNIKLGGYYDMQNKGNIQINLIIPEYFRDLLRKIAADRILKNPNQTCSGSSVAAEILIDALKLIEEEDRNNEK